MHTHGPNSPHRSRNDEIEYWCPGTVVLETNIMPTPVKVTIHRQRAIKCVGVGWVGVSAGASYGFGSGEFIGVILARHG